MDEPRRDPDPPRDGPRQAWRWLRTSEARLFDVWNRCVDRRISLSVGSALIVVGIGLVTKPLHTRLEFYVVVAQLMPVLMLVAAVNGRYFRERESADAFDRFLIRGFWVVGLLGIGAALVVVARGHDSVILRGLVVYGLALIGVMVTIYAIHGPAVEAPAESTPPPGDQEASAAAQTERTVPPAHRSGP
jgi:hypothetical protein